MNESRNGYDKYMSISTVNDNEDVLRNQSCSEPTRKKSKVDSYRGKKL